MCVHVYTHKASFVAQLVKHPPAMREAWIRSLGWEDPLEKGMPTYSSMLPGKSHVQRSLAGYRPWGHKELDTTEWLKHASSELASLIIYQQRKTEKRKTI